MRISTAAILLCGLAACQSAKPAARPLSSKSNSLLFPQGPLTQDNAVGSDADASRLHDIEGMLLYYYAVNKKMPDKLDDLTKYADFDQVPNFTCPSNGKPYEYYPVGLSTPNHDKLIIIADPAPLHSGNRYCIFISRPHPGAAMASEVLPIPEGLFKGYAPAQ